MARADDIIEDAAAVAEQTAAQDASPAAPTLRKRDLIDLVATQTGLKKRHARAATEALLAAMGDAVERGEAMALEPFGRMRVARVAEREGGQTLTCKLRRKTV